MARQPPVPKSPLPEVPHSPLCESDFPKSNLVQSEGSRVYKCGHPTGQNGNPGSDPLAEARLTFEEQFLGDCMQGPDARGAGESSC